MSTEQRAERIRPVDFRVYLITDRRIFGDDTDAMLRGTEEALKAGVKAVQLREKDLETRELLDLAYAMRALTLRYGADLFINDRADVAVAVEADGVHLGGSSIPVAAARRVVGEKLLLGVSTHGVAEAVGAEKSGADFITVGPVFDTPSKRHYGRPLGTEVLGEVTRETTIPVFAIGGIMQEGIKDIRAAGAFGIALISGILAAENIKSSAEDYVRALS